MGSIEILNIVLAITAALIALGAINRMNPKTECTIILSFVTVLAGVLGYAGGTVMPDRWQLACDTLLLGGVAGLLAGTRRQTIWVAPVWMPRISLTIGLLTWAAFFWAVA